MRNIILDSSVIIKWFKSKNEEKLDEARSFFYLFKNKQIEIYLMPLVFFELLNIAVYDQDISQDEWSNIIKVLFDLPFKILPITNKLAQNIYQLSKKYSISVYDASYIALAKSLKGNFITADKKLVKKVNLPFVKSL